MSSIKVKFRPSTSDGREGGIYFQIIHERVIRKWYSDYKIFQNEWNARKSMIVISSNKDADRQSYLLSIRERIKWDKERFSRILTEWSAKKDSFSADEVIEEFALRQTQLSFFNFMESIIVRIKEMGQKRTSETYTSALNSFRRFMNNEDILLDAFDSELMESYQAYLKSNGLVPNSISFYMRILRAVYNRAIEKNIIEDKHPFRHVYTGVDKTTKRAVDINTMKKIKTADLKMYPNAAYARDIFLLSFYFRGMSFVDMAFLKKSDFANGQIAYRRRKTGQRLAVKWTKEMQQIIEQYPSNDTDYLLPIITSSSATPYSQYRRMQYQVNKGLKVVAEKIGLKIPLTFYCSRHSWASIAKSKGVPVGVISDGLGHDSELTTQIYLSTLDSSAVDNANEMILKLL